MEIGIAFDLKSDFAPTAGEPDDRFEELDSEATVEAIEAALAKAGHRTRRLGGGRRFLSQALEAPGDLVFNIAEGLGTRSREAHVPAVLEMLGVPYTHSDPLTLAATLDKAVAKRLAASFGIATPRFALVERPGDLAGLRLDFPLFAKPAWEGSSMGIRARSRADDPRALAALVEELLAAYREPVLVEEFCAGPEFTVGILGTASTARVIGVMEVVPKLARPEDFVYSLEVKRSENWREIVDYVVPPPRPAEFVKELERLALSAYRALGCRDVARIDLRCGADGTPRFLEANPLPGLRPGWSDLSLLCERAGFAYDDLIAGIVDSARARQGL